jgi:tetratricopeptide (TPR) repeat protein
MTGSLLLRDGGRLPHALPKEEVEQVAAAYAKLREKHPGSVAVANAYAGFLWSVRRWDEAMAQWQEAERLDPNNAEAAHELGSCHLELGNARKATEYFQKATELAPTHPRYRFDLAKACHLFRHDLIGFIAPTADEIVTLAQKHYGKAAELDPANAHFAKEYAQTFYDVTAPDWDAALSAWKHYATISGNHDFANSNLARVALRLGRKEDALEYLARITNPEFARVKKALTRQAQGR